MCVLFLMRYRSCRSRWHTYAYSHAYILFLNFFQSDASSHCRYFLYHRIIKYADDYAKRNRTVIAVEFQQIVSQSSALKKQPTYSWIAVSQHPSRIIYPKWLKINRFGRARVLTSTTFMPNQNQQETSLFARNSQTTDVLVYFFYIGDYDLTSANWSREKAKNRTSWLHYRLVRLFILLFIINIFRVCA